MDTAAQTQARIAELKAKGGKATLNEATELDQAEKSEAAALKTRLEAELQQKGRLTADQARELDHAKATLARHAPMDPGPPPPVAQAVNDVRNLGKRDPATLTQEEAHQLADAHRSIARKGLDNLSTITGPLNNQQERARERFQAILDGSPYTTEHPPGPPPGYNPDSAYDDWYPPYGDKPAHPPDSAFSPDAMALTDSEIEAGMNRMKAQGHAGLRHHAGVVKGQLKDRVENKVDPITQTTEDAEHRGNDHRCAEHATQFTSDRAMVHAWNVIENSTEHSNARSKAVAKGNNTYVVKAITLESAFGPDYRQHVSGQSLLGDASNPLNPLRIEDAGLKDGTLFAQFKRDPGPPPGPFYLNTMFAKPKP